MSLHLLMRIEAPLVAFGDVMVDAIGPVTDTPSASMLTGLIANALGWRREERARHQRLQDRLIHAARLDRRAGRFVEFQTAKLGADDEGWTTRGRPEGRDGGAGTYLGPHIRRREHDADVSVAVALRLEPDAEDPTLGQIAAALDEPFRPLFIGRKPCLPTAPLFDKLVEAEDLLAALALVPLARARKGEADTVQIDMPAMAAMPPDGFHPVHVCDRRDWIAGVHAGDTVRWRASVPRADFVKAESAL